MAVMVLVVKCLICNEELTYTQGDPSILVAHIKFEHPHLHQKKGENKINKESLARAFSLINQSVQTDLKFIDMNSNRGKIKLILICNL